jgi:hypothetical protein
MLTPFRAASFLLLLFLLLPSVLLVVDALLPTNPHQHQQQKQQRPHHSLAFAGGSPYCHNPDQASPVYGGSSSPLCLSAARTDTTGDSSSTPSPPPEKRKKSTWDRFSSAINKVQDIAHSDDFQRLARGARILLKEIDIDVPTMEQNLGSLRRSLDRSLSSTLLTFENLLQLYEGRSPEADVLLNMARKQVTKLVQNGLNNLMSPTAIEWAVYAVNSTALLVEEEAARVLAEGQAAAENMLDEPTFVEMQREVMKRMVVVAEDAEGLAWGVIGSRWFRAGWSDDELTKFEALLNARLVPRLVLAVSAAVLHGWRPLQDPLLALLVVGYASGSVTKSVAGNFMGLFEASLVVKEGGKEGGVEGGGRGGGHVMDSFPDVWRTKETAGEIGEGLFRLFEALEKRSALRMDAQQARRAAAAAAAAAPRAVLAGSTEELDSTFTDLSVASSSSSSSSSSPTLLSSASPPSSSSSSLPSLPPLPSSSSPSTSPPSDKKFMVASYSFPNKLTALSGGAGVEGGREGGRGPAYYPAFTSTKQGKTLRYLTKTVHLTRTYWKTAATAMLGTVGLVFLARLYGTPATLTVSVGGEGGREGGGKAGGKGGRKEEDRERDGLLYSTPLEGLEE